jgi:hypothetical protein
MFNERRRETANLDEFNHLKIPARPQTKGFEFQLQGLKKWFAGFNKFLLKPQGAIAIAACPRFLAILVAAPVAIVCVLHVR